MRIFYHHRTLGDGAEGIHISAIVEAFRSLGHEVLVQGLAPPRERPTTVGLVQRVRQLLPAWIAELTAVALNLFELVAARRVIRRFRPDVIYKRHARYDIATLAIARRAGIPTVLEVNCVFSQGAYHEFEPHTFEALARWFERRALQLATTVVAVSTPLARQIEALANRPAHVLPNGVDLERFDPSRADPARVQQRHGLADRPTIGWVGILREWHGLELLVDAVAAVPEAQLLLVGDGPSKPAILERAAALNLTERVIITGRVDHDDVPDYVAAFDVAVVADERTGVASPMKLIEYMALGRLVAAPRLDNIRDLIDEEQDGLLFTQGSVAELTMVLRRAVDDPELRARLGRRARRKVEEERNWRAIARQALALSGSSTR